jgi:hypothetical protein
MEDIHKAKQSGVVFGRQKKLLDVDILQLKEKRGQGTFINDLMNEYSLSKPAFTGISETRILYIY